MQYQDGDENDSEGDKERREEETREGMWEGCIGKGKMIWDSGRERKGASPVWSVTHKLIDPPLTIIMPNKSMLVW